MSVCKEVLYEYKLDPLSLKSMAKSALQGVSFTYGTSTEIVQSGIYVMYKDSSGNTHYLQNVSLMYVAKNEIGNIHMYFHIYLGDYECARVNVTKSQIITSYDAFGIAFNYLSLFYASNINWKDKGEDVISKTGNKLVNLGKYLDVSEISTYMDSTDYNYKFTWEGITFYRTRLSKLYLSFKSNPDAYKTAVLSIYNKHPNRYSPSFTKKYKLSSYGGDTISVNMDRIDSPDLYYFNLEYGENLQRKRVMLFLKDSPDVTQTRYVTLTLSINEKNTTSDGTSSGVAAKNNIDGNAVISVNARIKNAYKNLYYVSGFDICRYVMTDSGIEFKTTVKQVRRTKDELKDHPEYFTYNVSSNIANWESKYGLIEYLYIYPIIISMSSNDTCGGDCMLDCYTKCTSSCNGVCMDNCKDGCDTKCSGNCGGSCSSDCGNSCDDDCTKACKGCKTECTFECDTSCSSNCKSGCKYGCSKNCSSGCETICIHNCKDTCSIDCGSNCKTVCKDGCKNTCSGDGCKSVCTVACKNSCKDSCNYLCASNCDVSCITTCGGNCEGSCTGNCKDTCELSCFGMCQYGCWGSKVPVTTTSEILTN